MVESGTKMRAKESERKKEKHRERERLEKKLPIAVKPPKKQSYKLID